MSTQNPRQHPWNLCPGQPRWASSQPQPCKWATCYCKYCHFMLQYGVLFLMYRSNCTQTLIQCLGVFWTITHKASWNNCHYFAFMFKKFFQEVGGCFRGLFFFYSEAIICPQLRLITAVYHTTCTHQPRGILPDLLVFLFSPIKCFISSDNVKSRSGVKIAVTTWSHFPFSRMKSEYWFQLFLWQKICLNSCSSQRKDPSGLSQCRT